VPKDAQLGVFFGHARAVVPDQHALAAAVGYLYLHARGPGVQGVLAELLHHEAGRSTTSPAATCCATRGSSSATRLKDRTPPHVAYTRVILLVGSSPITMGVRYGVVARQ
jgi:hypothetical protein